MTSASARVSRHGISRSRPAWTAAARVTGIVAVAATIGIFAGSAVADEVRTAFRPCIDPSNLPFANDKGEGFENRIAELFAKQLGVPVQNYSFPQRMNFIRNTLRYKLPGEDFRCDIVMSVPAVFDQALPTAPYYHSTYALVYRKGQGIDGVKSGADLFALPADVRDKLRIGIYDRSPAAIWLVRHGMEAQVKPYPMMSPNPDQYPGEIIDKDLAQGTIDAAVVWGPIAGYYAKRVRNMELVVIPLKSEPGVKFDYEIAMGVRQGEREWKATVDKLLVDNRTAIASILREYNVPIVDAQGDPVN
jgi:quinoprotein dehydrogenase-associated probable ABC transporter substrate-binding protein